MPQIKPLIQPISTTQDALSIPIVIRQQQMEKLILRVRVTQFNGKMVVRNMDHTRFHL